MQRLYTNPPLKTSTSTGIILPAIELLETGRQPLIRSIPEVQYRSRAQILALLARHPSIKYQDWEYRILDDLIIKDDLFLPLHLHPQCKLSPQVWLAHHRHQASLPRHQQ